MIMLGYLALHKKIAKPRQEYRAKCMISSDVRHDIQTEHTSPPTIPIQVAPLVAKAGEGIAGVSSPLVAGCHTLLCWNEVGERELCGPEIIHDKNEKIKVVRDRLKAAQSRQKSYADVCRKDLEFQVGDWVFLKLSPWKGVVRFGKHGKLSPRYIGPYEILERVGSLAYRLALPLELSRIHNAFHVSILRKYIADPSHVLKEQPISLQKDLSYEEESIQILDRNEQVLKSKSIPLVKVLWRSHQVEEPIWELEEQMRQQYPYLFE
ncbi:hypothetical protein ACLB2K_072502 [Fragaria x ananassa]